MGTSNPMPRQHQRNVPGWERRRHLRPRVASNVVRNTKNNPCTLALTIQIWNGPARQNPQVVHPFVLLLLLVYSVSRRGRSVNTLNCGGSDPGEITGSFGGACRRLVSYWYTQGPIGGIKSGWGQGVKREESLNLHRVVCSAVLHLRFVV